MPKVAIIILGFNSQKHIADCLGSLTSLNYPEDKYQIFWFDNNSQDNSISEIKEKYPQIEVIASSQNLGFAAGNNQAVKMISQKEDFKYYCLINDDTMADKDFLTQLVKVIESDEKIAACQARLMLYSQENKVNSIGNQIHFLGFGYAQGNQEEFDGDLSVKEIIYGSGAALLIRKSVIDQLGLFEEDFFMYHEDLDFGWKARLAGYKIVLAPQAVVYHKYKFAKSVKQYYWMERNRLICLWKNYKLATLIIIFPAWLVMEIGLFIFAIKSGFIKEKLKVIFYFLKPSSWQKIFLAKSKIKQIRKIKDRQIIQLFVGQIKNQEIDNFILKKIANPVLNLYWRIVRSLIFW